LPPREKFSYTFDNIARIIDRFTEIIGFDRFAVYVFDYGAPTGFRLALRHPERITAIISQNGNAYEEGLSDGWNPIKGYWQGPSQANRQALRALLAPETTRFQYTHGAPDQTLGSPDGQNLDNFYLTRSGADEVQLISSAITKATSPYIPHFRPISVHTSHHFWRHGARTIRSFCRRARRRSSATILARLFAASTPVIRLGNACPRDRGEHPRFPEVIVSHD
jgi:pimeloyl-ACP methyl ester carboxylesterase